MCQGAGRVACQQAGHTARQKSMPEVRRAVMPVHQGWKYTCLQGARGAAGGQARGDRRGHGLLIGV